MLAVEGFVKTALPCARAIPTSILVVVDFPAEPVTTINPSGNFESVDANKPGAILLRTRPGSADPPPFLTSRIAKRANLPIKIAGKYFIVWRLVDEVAKRLRARRVAKL